MKNAVIFDLDGTLWDSSKQVTDSWNIVLERHGLPLITVADMHSLMGRPMNEIAQLIMPRADVKLREGIMNECMYFENMYLKTHSGVCYPGLRETLSRLCGKYLLMIVSNCQDGYIQVFLENSALGGFFRDFESFGRTRLQKDGNIRLIMERNGAENAVYVGDTQGDLDSADLAGVPFIHAAYGFGKTDRETPAINALDELEDVVDEIFGEN